jgi:DHA1 family bicyclomycin/chloramphenicol resistance-like MFS transporter
VWALAASSLFGVAFIVLAAAGAGGLAAFVVPVWLILGAMGLVIPNAPALALSRHSEASGTSAALLGAAQFGLGAAVAPLVGVLGNSQVALAVVMTAGAVIALAALVAARVGQPSADDEEFVGAAMAEPV